MNPQTSRRSFLRFAGLAASLPLVSESHLAWAAMQQATPVAATKEVPRSRVFHAFPPGSVVINANENPMGPSPAALTAIATAAATGGRYDANGLVDHLTKTAASQFDIPTDHIGVYAGSSEPLHYTVWPLPRRRAGRHGRPVLRVRHVGRRSPTPRSTRSR